MKFIDSFYRERLNFIKTMLADTFRTNTSFVKVTQEKLNGKNYLSQREQTSIDASIFPLIWQVTKNLMTSFGKLMLMTKKILKGIIVTVVEIQA